MGYDISVEEQDIPGISGRVMTIRIRKYTILSSEFPTDGVGEARQTIAWDRNYDKYISFTEEKRPDVYKVVKELAAELTKP